VSADEVEAKAALAFSTTPELQERTRDYLLGHKTWGRWGDEDQRGAANLQTPERRLAALGAVRSGRTVSLSREVRPPEENAIGFFSNRVFRSPQFGDAFMRTAEDALELRHHGNGITHLDALCHVWLDGVGMWNGRDPDAELAPEGARWGDVAQWRDGLVGRAVLLDVPGHRGADFVDVGEPITSAELAAVAEAQGSSVQPGDMLLVYGGRDRWEAAVDPPRSYHWTPDGRAGLAPDCVEFIRDHDVSVLMWDMLESEVLSVHGVLWAFGVAIVDNCDLSRLVPLCRETGHYELCVVIAPLVMPGATGSAVNPIAIL
jgi:hypothetical protein